MSLKDTYISMLSVFTVMVWMECRNVYLNTTQACVFDYFVSRWWYCPGKAVEFMEHGVYFRKADFWEKAKASGFPFGRPTSCPICDSKRVNMPAITVQNLSHSCNLSALIGRSLKLWANINLSPYLVSWVVKTFTMTEAWKQLPCPVMYK